MTLNKQPAARLPRIDGTSLIAVRDGSKGLAQKNSRTFRGTTLFEIALEQALLTSRQCIVSTDIPEFLARQWPTNVIMHKRPQNLCGDDVSIADVILDALATSNQHSSYICLLQATSPLRTTTDIKNALELYQSEKYDLVMSVTETDPSPYKFGAIDSGFFSPMREPEHCFANRQNLPKLYRPNGAVYVFDRDQFEKHRGFPTSAIGASVMPQNRSIDIDSIEDFELAERMFSRAKT